jgi:hypothetical protein
MSGYKKFLGPEDKLQIAVNAYLTAAYPTALFCHVPNEGKRSPFERYKFKELGGKAGVPDLLVFTPSKQYNGLAIELKAGKNKATKAQQEWLDNLTNNGWASYCLRDFDTIKQTIDKYFKNDL